MKISMGEAKIEVQYFELGYSGLEYLLEYSCVSPPGSCETLNIIILYLQYSWFIFQMA